MPDAATFLALRYLRPKRSFVSVISMVSLAGVAVGVMMLIVVKSVMLGFDAEFRATLLGAEPHLLLRGEEPVDFDQAEALRDLAEVDPRVVSAVVHIGGILYARTEHGQTGFQIYGIEGDRAELHLQKLKPHVLQGSLDLQQGGLILSDYAAGQLGASVGDEILVYESGAVDRAAQQFKEAMNLADEEERRERQRAIQLQSSKLRLSGIVRGENSGYHGFTSLQEARSLFGLTNQVHGVALELQDAYQTEEVGQQLLPAEGWQTRTWLDDGQARLAAMRNEQIMMTVILWIIAVVAAFAVMNTTITVTTQKRREIGVLAALGMPRQRIVGVFVRQALIVGALGVTAGVSLALAALHWRNDMRAWIAYLSGTEVYAIEGILLAEIPSQLEASTVWFAAGGSLLLCLIAGWLPAWVAAKMQPADALRDI